MAMPFSYRFHRGIELLAEHYRLALPPTYQPSDCLVKRITAAATELIDRPAESVRIDIIGGTGVGRPGTWQETCTLTRRNTSTEEARDACRSFVQYMDRCWVDFRRQDGPYAVALSAIDAR